MMRQACANLKVSSAGNWELGIENFLNFSFLLVSYFVFPNYPARFLLLRFPSPVLFLLKTHQSVKVCSKLRYSYTF